MCLKTFSIGLHMNQLHNFYCSGRTSPYLEPDRVKKICLNKKMCAKDQMWLFSQAWLATYVGGLTFAFLLRAIATFVTDAWWVSPLTMFAATWLAYGAFGYGLGYARSLDSGFGLFAGVLSLYVSSAIALVYTKSWYVPALGGLVCVLALLVALKGVRWVQGNQEAS